MGVVKKGKTKQEKVNASEILEDRLEAVAVLRETGKDAGSL